MLKRVAHLFFVSIFAVSFSIALNVNDSEAQDEGNVVDVVKESDDHTIFADLLEESQLDQRLNEEGPFTVMAPTDEAFEEHGDVEELKENPEQVQQLVINHLFQGENSASELEPQIDAEIEEGDIEASNGVVHEVDQVIEPSQQ